MKIKSVYFFTLLVVCSAGIVRAQFTQARLQVAGLNCALCAKTTERELKALPFISDVKPDLMHNIYVITFKPGQVVSFDQIGKIVRDENFFITFFKATINFDGVKLSGDAFSNGGDTYRLLNPAGKPLTGQLEFTLVDKGFAPRSVSKKYVNAAAEYPSQAGKVYHLAI
jgi:copper chaperone CopZ